MSETDSRNRTADHDIDEAQNTQITIYAGRGLCKCHCLSRHPNKN